MSKFTLEKSSKAKIAMVYLRDDILLRVKQLPPLAEGVAPNKQLLESIESLKVLLNAAKSSRKNMLF